MRITIAQRFQPFSHIPGVRCLLPGSTLRLQLFPTLIKVSDLSEALPKDLGDITLPIEGPLEGFTVLQDLEKGKILLWGKSSKGFKRFHISHGPNGLSIQDDDGNSVQIPFKTNSNNYPLSKERLSLGNHKAQDWDLVNRRLDLSEIFPLWMRLGQSLPHAKNLATSSLLHSCKDSEAPYSDFLNLFKAGFEGILSPRAKDEQFQGFHLDPIGKGDSLLTLLSEGASLIRSLFIRQNKNSISILPQLPQQFHSGRITNLNLEGIGTLDIEWSKKQIRKMILRSSSKETIQFNFGKKISSVRFSQVSQTKGSRIQASSSIDIHPGESYLFDRFEH